jgi:4'-phosphopantetheinyl transferase EntD
MEEVRRLIATALGPGARVAMGDPRRPPPEAPWPEEASAVRRAVPGRQRELAWGRHLARAALVELGGPRLALPPKPDRRPQWPPGFVGSISHCEDLCAVVVASTLDYRAVGIDVEPDSALDGELVPIVMTRKEQAAMGIEPGAPSEIGKVFFVVKEAYYKAQFELTETLLDFSEVEVELEADDGFRATCVRTGLAPLHGRWARRDGHVVAWVAAPTAR